MLAYSKRIVLSSACSLILASLIVILCQSNENLQLTLACHLSAIQSPPPPHQPLHKILRSARMAAKNSTKQILIKLALFLDTSLEHHLTYNLNLNKKTMNQLAVAYVDQIEAIFASLKSDTISKIHIALVEMRLETHLGQFRTKTSNGGDDDGDIDRLLSDFCLYQANERQRSETKWDLGLLLTAQDLYSAEEADMSSMEASLSTMGISPVNGIGWPDLSCSMVELGVGYTGEYLEDSSEHRVYPTRGFASAWIAAHEVAHSIGLHHDGAPFNDECKSDMWIMSPTSYIGSMNHLWSRCSTIALDSLNLSKFTISSHDDDDGQSTLINFNELPGQMFDTQFQCKMYSSLLKGPPINTDAICNETLKCLGPDNQLVPIGPALEGTTCGENGRGACIQNSCKMVQIN